jgi:hypothetical protein
MKRRLFAPLRPRSPAFLAKAFQRVPIDRPATAFATSLLRPRRGCTYKSAKSTAPIRLLPDRPVNVNKPFYDQGQVALQIHSLLIISQAVTLAVIRVTESPPLVLRPAFDVHDRIEALGHLCVRSNVSPPSIRWRVASNIPHAHMRFGDLDTNKPHLVESVA